MPLNTSRQYRKGKMGMSTNKNIITSGDVALIAIISQAYAVPVNGSQQIVSETIEAVAKKSGKALTPVARKAAEKAFVQAFKQYGDDVFKIVSRGGLNKGPGVKGASLFRSQTEKGLLGSKKKHREPEKSTKGHL